MKITNFLIFVTIIFLCSCNVQKKLNYSSEFLIPEQNFNETDTIIELDYSNEKNWVFRSDLHNYKKILPKNYKIKYDEMFDVSVFYIHPTTLFSSKKWNADTTHFLSNN